MKVGNFEIPEIRLMPNLMDTLGEIYKAKKRDKIQSKDLAIFLGFKYGTEPHYYRKIRSLTDYGLIEGKGNFQISELGEKLLHPRDGNEKSYALTNSVLNVPLWKEIHQKYGKKPREGNFWAALVDITKIDPTSAKENASKILGWYLTDIAHVSDKLALFEPSKKTIESIRQNDIEDIQMSRQLVHPTHEILEPKSESDFITYKLRKSIICLSKDNPKKEWKKIKKMIDIDLEDYEDDTSEKVKPA